MVAFAKRSTVLSYGSQDNVKINLSMEMQTPSLPVSSPPPFWSKARRYLIKADPVLATILKRHRSEKLVPRGDAFFSLARSIIGQQISVKAAQSVSDKLAAELGEITITTVATAGRKRLRGCGLSKQKSLCLYELANHFKEGALNTQQWHNLDDQAVIKQLTQFKGIGPWTAEMFLIFHMMRPDVLPLADLGIQKAMRVNFNKGTSMSKEEMVAKAEPWRPWRSVAVWYLWRSLDPLPVAY